MDSASDVKLLLGLGGIMMTLLGAAFLTSLLFATGRKQDEVVKHGDISGSERP